MTHDAVHTHLNCASAEGKPCGEIRGTQENRQRQGGSRTCTDERNWTSGIHGWLPS